MQTCMDVQFLSDLVGCSIWELLVTNNIFEFLNDEIVDIKITLSSVSGVVHMRSSMRR